MGSDDIKKRQIAKNRARRKQQRDKRKNNVTTDIPKILILTEGVSELLYFKSLQQEIFEIPKTSLTIKQSQYTDAVGIVTEGSELGEKAINDNDEYDYIFCIFDLDTVKNLKFVPLIRNYNSNPKYKKYSQIYPIVSYPCIELWFILHYNCHQAPFTNTQKKSIGDTAKSELKNYLPDYHETNEDSVKTVVNRYKTALFNANKLAEHQLDNNSINPITNIQQLVKLLENIYKRPHDYEYPPKVENTLADGKLDTFILNNIKVSKP